MPCRSSRHTRRRRAALVQFVIAVSCAVALPAFAATPSTVTSKAATDGPIRYTVRVASKQFGNAQETRTLRSGDTDDFTWRTTPPGGAVATPQGCPDYATLPLDATTGGAQWTLATIDARFAQIEHADPWAAYGRVRQRLTAELTLSLETGGK